MKIAFIKDRADGEVNKRRVVQASKPEIKRLGDGKSVLEEYCALVTDDASAKTALETIGRIRDQLLRDESMPLFDKAETNGSDSSAPGDTKAPEQKQMAGAK